MEKFTKKKDEKLEKLKACAEALLDPDKARLPEITRDYPRRCSTRTRRGAAGGQPQIAIASDRPELSGGSAVGRCGRRRCGTTSSQTCSSCARSRGQSGARETKRPETAGFAIPQAAGRGASAPSLDLSLSLVHC